MQQPKQTTVKASLPAFFIYNIMNININKFLFSRTQPIKKIETINKMTNSEILAANIDTIKRIIKEAGVNHYKSRDKVLAISHKRRVSNGWNSSCESIETCKKKILVALYVQYGDCDTDTTEYVEFVEFFSHGDYEGTIKGVDYHFNTKYYYYYWNQEQKVQCLRSFLLEYVYTKYRDKLKEENS